MSFHRFLYAIFVAYISKIQHQNKTALQAGPKLSIQILLVTRLHLGLRERQRSSLEHETGCPLFGPHPSSIGPGENVHPGPCSASISFSTVLVVVRAATEHTCGHYCNIDG